MKSWKHSLKACALSTAIGLSLLVLGVSTVQAAAFLENGSAISSLKIATGEVDLLLSYEIPALNIEVDCAEFTVLEGALLGTEAGEEPGIAHVKLLFQGCNAYVLSPLEIQAGCKIFPTAADRAAGTHEGKVLTVGLLSVFLHAESVPYLKFIGPGEEKIFSQVFSTGCTGVPNGVKVKGSGVLDLHLGGETNREKQLATMANLSLFPNALKFGENEARFLGSIWMKLSSNNPWGIC